MGLYFLQASSKILSNTQISFPESKFPFQIKHPCMWQSQSIIGQSIIIFCSFLAKGEILCDLNMTGNYFAIFEGYWMRWVSKK